MPVTDDTGPDTVQTVQAVSPGWPTPITLPIGQNPYPSAIISGACRLMGWSVRETTGAALAEVDIFSGSSTTGLLVAKVTLAANESNREWFGPAGIRCNGIYTNFVTGSIDGVLFVIPE